MCQQRLRCFRQYSRCTTIAWTLLLFELVAGAATAVVECTADRALDGKGDAMTMNLEGKVALVTGASKGVGKGIALELARQGCSVVVNYHSDEPGAAATVQEIQALGQKALAVKANVGIAAEVDAMFAA